MHTSTRLTFRYTVAVCFELFQVLGEEDRELVGRNKFNPAVKIDVAGVRNHDQLLWLTGNPVGIQIRTLLLYAPMGVPDNDGGISRVLVSAFGMETIPDNIHVV